MFISSFVKNKYPPVVSDIYLALYVPLTPDDFVVLIISVNNCTLSFITLFAICVFTYFSLDDVNTFILSTTNLCIVVVSVPVILSELGAVSNVLSRLASNDQFWFVASDTAPNFISSILSFWLFIAPPVVVPFV